MAVPPPATADPGPAPGGADQLEVYTGTLDGVGLERLRQAGVDLGHSRRNATAQGTRVEVVLTGRQAQRLAADGVELTVKTVQGRPASGELRRQSADGYTVFRSYSEPGGIRDELEQPRPASRS